eukprot:m.23787 g.23787  ORF g.23787 m.23787 type:complete len:214 (+) comp11430_c0_seq2:170-811(+)
MLGPLGIVRWAFRPLDKLLFASAAIVGTAMTTPRILYNVSTLSSARALSQLEIWRACAASPLGAYAFAGFVNFAAPYSGSVRPILTKMNAIEAEGYIVEQPWLTNPFNSVHAVALTNLGEFVSGIIVTSQLEQMSLTQANITARGIVTSLGSTYHKKARGTITAKCTPPPLPTTEGKHAYKVLTELYDAQGVHVATTEAQWHILIKNTAVKQA